MICSSDARVYSTITCVLGVPQEKNLRTAYMHPSHRQGVSAIWPNGGRLAQPSCLCNNAHCGAHGTHSCNVPHRKQEQNHKDRKVSDTATVAQLSGTLPSYLLCVRCHRVPIVRSLSDSENNTRIATLIKTHMSDKLHRPLPYRAEAAHPSLHTVQYNTARKRRCKMDTLTSLQPSVLQQNCVSASNVMNDRAFEGTRTRTPLIISCGWRIDWPVSCIEGKFQY